MRAILACVFAGCLIAFVACSDDDAAPTASPTSATATVAGGSPNLTDVCALLTYDETTAFMGARATDRAATVPPVHGQVAPGVNAWVSGCEYRAAATGDYVRMNLYEEPGDSVTIRQYVEGLCTGLEAISGLGDLACWVGSGELQVAKGGAYLNFGSSTTGGTPDGFISLAQTAVSRLP